MLSAAITLLTGVVGFYWSIKARNPFTKFTSLCLSGISLASIAPPQMIQQNVPYLLAFFCLMAGFEPGSSQRIRAYHKLFFGAFGIVFALVALDRVVHWPFSLTLWPLGVLYLIVVAVLLRRDLKMLRTRLGVVSVWMGMAFTSLLTAI